MKFTLVLIVLLATAISAQGVTIETVPVGNAANLPDSTGFGSVPYSFRIGTHEVTNAQYVEFLNSVDSTGANTLALYEITMSADARGGITFTSGAANGSKYNVKSGRDNNPVVFVSWYDSIRFANWMNNGMGSGGTENGAYTLLGGTPTPSNANSITRNPGAKWWLPSENEWYKAAYHKDDGMTGNYWDYPTSTDAEPFSDQPPGTDAPDPSNTANFYKIDGAANGYDDGYAATGSPSFNGTQNYLTDVGAYTSALSPYGTFDQGGNVWEWNEALISSSFRGIRGGSWCGFCSGSPHVSSRASALAEGGAINVGFRVASIPEPSTLLLTITAFATFLTQRRLRTPLIATTLVAVVLG